MELNLEDKLESILKHVNDWLKYAEQKTATLLALNAGAVWGVSRILNGTTSEQVYVYWGSSIGYVFLLLSVFVCLTSFFPVLNTPWFKPGEKNDNDNSIYFGHIAKYRASEYLNLLKSKTGFDNECLNWELDYANQITSNASIALDKFKRYKLASWLFFIAVLFFLVAFGINFFG